MGTTQFLLGIHCHQPVDNFHHVVDEAIARSYRPFFEVLERYPEFHFSVHFSGWLLEYIHTHDRELFTRMQSMAKRGQVEFFTGGFYEPILASIPSRDRIDQINKLSTFITTHFGQTPRGLWLTERVWDSALVADMVTCGIEYVLVDDYHFISTGFDAKKLAGYYLTEAEGKRVALFPIDKGLRYMVPFRPADAAADFLEQFAPEESSPAAVLFDDGEKFGIWPKTHEWVYEKGWLEAFLSRIVASDKVKAVRYDEYYDTHKPLGLAYLPPYSYYEMGEWSLRGEDAQTLEAMHAALEPFGEEGIDRFLKGSIWKNFLIKYPESNLIHKRVLALSAERAACKTADFDDALFRAQTNDVLWHGVFGGIYLPNLRDNAWRFILHADAMAHTKRGMSLADWNMDGYEEITWRDDAWVLNFTPKQGAQLCEIGLKDVAFNLQNTMTRYRESYHLKLLNPKPKSEKVHTDGIDTIHELEIEDLEHYRKQLHVDWYTRHAFIDHIVDGSFSAEGLQQCSFNEYGDFANQPFETLSASGEEVSFVREGGIYRAGVKHDARLEKRYRFDSEGKVTAALSLQTHESAGLWYAQEHNLHFADITQVSFNGAFLEENLRFEGGNVVIEDGYTQKRITITLSQAAYIVVVPIHSLSQSEKGFDATLQGVAIALVASLDAGTTFQSGLMIETRK